MAKEDKRPRWKMAMLSVAAAALLAACGSSVVTVYASSQVPLQACDGVPCTMNTTCRIINPLCICTGTPRNPGTCISD